MTYHVVSLSGGKNSTAMLLKLLEKNHKVDEIVYVDTKTEFPELYEHLDQLEEYLQENYGLGITRLEFDHDIPYYMTKYKRKKEEQKDKPLGFPSLRIRWCTAMKRDVFNKYIRDKNLTEIVVYIGFAKEEKHRAKLMPRVKNMRFEYPLLLWDMTSEDCLTYCKQRGFDWNGIYEKFDHLGCWICPFQSLKSIKTLIKEYPEKWQAIKRIEKHLRDLGVKQWKFRADYSTDEIEALLRERGEI